jgi:cysteine synthase
MGSGGHPDRLALDARRNPGQNAGMHTSTSILELIGRTPMVRLDRIGTHLPVPILGKCEFLDPGGSVKDRIALAILDDAERNNRIAPGATLIEAPAGNTGMGQALVAAARGYRPVCVMPEKMSADKRAALAAVRSEVIIVPNAPPSSPDNFQNLARRGSEAGS